MTMIFSSHSSSDEERHPRSVKRDENFPQLVMECPMGAHIENVKRDEDLAPVFWNGRVGGVCMGYATGPNRLKNDKSAKQWSE